MFHRISNCVAVFPKAFGLDPAVQYSLGANGERFTHLNSMNRNVIACFDFSGKPDHVPIREANAAMAHSVSNRTGIVGAVNANPFLLSAIHITPTGFRGPGT